MAEFWDGKILLVMADDPKYATKKVRTRSVPCRVSNTRVLHVIMLVVLVAGG